MKLVWGCRFDFCITKNTCKLYRCRFVLLKYDTPSSGFSVRTTSIRGVTKTHWCVGAWCTRPPGFPCLFYNVFSLHCSVVCASCNGQPRYPIILIDGLGWDFYRFIQSEIWSSYYQKIFWFCIPNVWSWDMGGFVFQQFVCWVRKSTKQEYFSFGVVFIPWKSN